MKAQGLDQIKRLYQAAQREREHLLALAAAERERVLLLQREHQLFTHSIGPIARLKPNDRVIRQTQAPSTQPQQRQQDERAVLRESISDDFDVETLLETDEALSFRQAHIGSDVVRKLRRGHWSLQGQIDLHGLRTDDAREALSTFIQRALKQDWRCVRVVHGKGLGSPGKTPVLKVKALRWLAQRKDVLAFVQARACDGGAGALIVLLQANNPRQRAPRAMGSHPNAGS
jgi:DNA-nicking Smr family endonuclease